MEENFNKTMLAVPYIRGFHLNEDRAKILISKYKEVAADIVNKINIANGGMFTRNVEIRAVYFKDVLIKNINNFEQLLILGIGLDTKFDEIEMLKDKSIFAIDLSESDIKYIYNEANLKTDVKIVHGDLNNLEKTNTLENLISVGLDVNKKTFILWEYGAAYLEREKVFNSLRFLKNNLNISGFTGDFLNEEVFYDSNHPLKDMIQNVVSILEKSGNPWKGFFKTEDIYNFLNFELNLNLVNIIYHGNIEESFYKEPLVIHNLIFFVNARN